MQRVIFLDVDGPLINEPIYFVDCMCSIKRTVFNTQAIGYVIEIAEKAEAKIVMNSTHNTHDIEGRTIKDDLINWRVPAELFHENWRTEFPYPRDGKFSASSMSRRMNAIKCWIEDNGDADWIAFDDEEFTLDRRLILIDFRDGIDYKAYKKATKFWNIKEQKIFA